MEEKCIFCWPREQGKHGEVKELWYQPVKTRIAVCEKHRKEIIEEKDHLHASADMVNHGMGQTDIAIMTLAHVGDLEQGLNNPNQERRKDDEHKSTSKSDSRRS